MNLKFEDSLQHLSIEWITSPNQKLEMINTVAWCGFSSEVVGGRGGGEADTAEILSHVSRGHRPGVMC